jgi:hypothetical protein
LTSSLSRFFVREGELGYLDAKKGRKILSYLFLFNDCLLLSKKQADLAGHKYHLRYVINLGPSCKLETADTNRMVLQS